ncbi:MAG: response regulator [Chrysiogenetes bacterium]|nr:response regulator [Chrysiogenetes bacterium]
MEKCLVLAVDDMAYMESFYTKSLKGLPVEVHFVSSGEEACRVAEKLKPQLIFMDFLMPRMDGEATASIIRRMPGMEKAKIIAVTAIDEGEAASLSGFDAFLHKPVRADDLSDVVARCLGEAAE